MCGAGHDFRSDFLGLKIFKQRWGLKSHDHQHFRPKNLVK